MPAVVAGLAMIGFAIAWLWRRARGQRDEESPVPTDADAGE